MSKWYDWVPDVIFYHDDNHPGIMTMGEFEEGLEEITINLAACWSVKVATSTMIHEYVHYLQCPSWYTRYSEEYKYDDHPYEIQANDIAERDVSMFVSTTR
jgi:hypothetical protein